MAHVSLNNDPLLDRLVFAYDGTNYRVVKANTDGELIVAVKDDQNIQSRQYGYIGGDWQKQPLQFGFSGAVQEQVVNSNLNAGSNVLNGTVVPSGEFWVITQITAYMVSTTINRLRLFNTIGGDNIYIDDIRFPTSSKMNGYQGNWILDVGDRINLNVNNATSGDTAHLYYSGYKVDKDL